jgi:hypothetical protein
VWVGEALLERAGFQRDLWTTSLQTVTTLALVGVTAWYASLTRDLVQATATQAKVSAETLAETRTIEIRRGILELRRFVYTINVPAINLASVATIASLASRDNIGVVAKQQEDAITQIRSICESLYASVMALIDDLPFVGDELRESTNQALVSLMFLSVGAEPGEVMDRAGAWGRVRVELLTVVDTYQGRSRVWKPWSPPPEFARAGQPGPTVER